MDAGGNNEVRASDSLSHVVSQSRSTYLDTTEPCVHSEQTFDTAEVWYIDCGKKKE